MIEMFTKFLADEQANDMYVTGPAGSGKTTDLAESVGYCKNNGVEYVVCAFTHKACGILRTKLPPNANVRTLHSFLKKRPGINQDATKAEHVQSNFKHGKSDVTSIMFIDEYSMVGERDLMDIRDAQDEAEDKGKQLKVVWIGDANQLPPVGDMQSVVPQGKYKLQLTKIYRNDNELQEPLNQLISFIGGADPEPLKENSKFIRNQDIIEWYDNDAMAEDHDGVMLAFTNERVQQLNAAAQGYGLPKPGDKVFSPNTREHYTFGRVLDPREVSFIEKPFGNEMLGLGSKYKTLEHVLKNKDYKFVELFDEEGESRIYCSIFGHYDYKLYKESLMEDAASANRKIEHRNPGNKATAWASQNRDDPLAKKRGNAWRNYLAFNECCVCLDFVHAMTVHKSQGSTYKNVYIDTEDLGVAARTNYNLYLKLLYVAISRASDTVVTN